jgi:hypothetical protein
MHMSPMYCTFIRVGTISEGIQNTEIFWGSALVFVDRQKPLKVLVVDDQKVFVNRFLCTRVLKWTNKNKKFLYKKIVFM